MLQKTQFNDTTPYTPITSPALVLMLTVGLLPVVRAGLDHPILDGLAVILLIASLSQLVRGQLVVYSGMSRVVISLALFVLWCGFSMVWSLELHRTLVEFLQTLSYALVFLLVLNLSEDQVYLGSYY